MGEALRISSSRTTVPARDPAGQESKIHSTQPFVPLRKLMTARALQPQLAVGAVDDPFEREAERTAETVTSADPVATKEVGRPPVAASLMRLVRRAVGKTELPARKDEEDKNKRVQKAPSLGGGSETVPANVETSIHTMSRGGEPLSPGLRSTFEPRFGYDFGSVRIHTGESAAGSAVALGARAFTVGDHVFFGPGEYQPSSRSGQKLIAHELTHTIQQKPAAARPLRVQRDWSPKATALAKIDQWANELPPWELLTVLLGRNPITDKQVERNSRNFLHGALKMVPDGMAIFDDLEKNKSIEKTSAWFDAEVTKLNLTWDGIKALFNQAWDAIDATDFLSPSKAWEKVKAIFAPTLKRIGDFAFNVGSKILDFIKKAVLGKIGAWAKEQKGYSLLTFVLGKDPVTDEPVERTAKVFVKAVLDLVPGGDKIFENLEKSKTIEKTVAWLNEEITKLDLTWEKIKELFKKAWDAFNVADLLQPLKLLEKMGAIFLPPAKRVITFAIAVGKKVLEFIFEGAMMIAGPIGVQIVGIVRKIGDTFNKIVDDPVAFVGNLVQAVKLGFQQFGKNIWEHLKTGLIGWLVGALEGAGLVLPKVWDLKGILSLVLQILGISYAKMRVKLVKVIGEKRVAQLEQVFAFLKAIITGGPAAAWQMIVDAIGSLWDMVIGGIKDWAVTKIVTAALLKLVTMFNPAGAIIQAIIATYNTIAFFIERIKQILALVESIVDSIANIAAGKLAQAAKFVETAMARTIPVILGFLARLIGLGDVSGAIKKVITGIHEKVDKAIDAVIAWIVAKAKALFGIKDDKDKDKGSGLPDGQAKKSFAMAGEPHTLTLRVQNGEMTLTMASIADVVLRNLAADAIEDVKKSPRKDDEKAFYIAHLSGIRDKCHNKKLDQAYQEAGRPKDADGWMLGYVGKIIDQDLLPIADHGIESLTKFFAKIPSERFLPPDYRGQWIRKNLYVSDAEWGSVSGPVRQNDLKAIKADIAAAKTVEDWNKLRIAPPPDNKAGYKVPSWATPKFTSADLDKVAMEVDHKVPIAKHWTEYGFKQNDDERGKIGKQPSNLELVTKEYNSRKQALGAQYRHSVEAGFESDMAQSTLMSPKIKGKAFLRSKDGPPII